MICEGLCYLLSQFFCSSLVCSHQVCHGWWIYHIVAVTDVLSWLIKFTVTGLTIQSLCYPHILPFTAIKIIAVIIHHCPTPPPLIGCMFMVLVGRTKKKGLLQRNHVVWTKQWVHDDWCSLQEVTASQFCSVLWDLYSSSSIQVRSQPKGANPKAREHRLRSDVNWQGALELKGTRKG